MLRATPHLPSSPPIKSQNASFSVAALLVQRYRGGAEGSLFSAAVELWPGVDGQAARAELA